MKKTIARICKLHIQNLFLVIGLVIMLGLSSCTVPFEYQSNAGTIEIPTTGGFYFESATELSEEARSPRLTLTELNIHYTVRKGSSFTADVALYATKKLEADGIEGDVEVLVEEELGLAETSKSGVSTSEYLKTQINARAERLVFGAKNTTLSVLLEPVYIDYYFTIKGTVTVFP